MEAYDTLAPNNTPPLPKVDPLRPPGSRYAVRSDKAPTGNCPRMDEVPPKARANNLCISGSSYVPVERLGVDPSHIGREASRKLKKTAGRLN